MSKNYKINVVNMPKEGLYYKNCPDLTENDISLFHTENISSKVIIIGDSGVGKTCLLNRIVCDHFSDEYKATIGACFTPVMCKINNHYLTLAMWDMAGQEQFTAMNRHYFRGANIVFLCFDLTNPSSLESLKKWYNVVNDNVHDPIGLFLIGCKSDLQKKVKDSIIQEFSQSFKLEYFEVSAKEKSFTDELAQRTCFISAIYLQRKRESVDKPQIQFAEVIPSFEPASRPKGKTNCC